MNDLNHRSRRAALISVVSVLILAGVGCAKSGTAPSNSGAAGSSETETSAAVISSSETGTPSSLTSSSEADTTPSAEGTGPESPQKSHDAGPVADLPSLPIGGGTQPTVGSQQCADVNWLGPKPIPPGIMVTIDMIKLSSEEIFKLGGSCTSGGALCTTSWQWTSQTENVGCAVAATQIASVATEQSVPLTLVGRVLCGHQSECDAFAAKSTAGSSIEFVAEPGAIPGDSSSSSSNMPPPSSDQNPPVTPSSSSEGSSS